MHSPVPTSLLLFALCWPLHAQRASDDFVTETEARQHQLTHAEPIFPSIAKAAHVHGTVVLQITVSRTGQVTATEVLDGPPMLRAAAETAVRSWTFTPFTLNDKPAAVRTAVSVPFPDETEKADQAVSQTYFAQDRLCRADLSGGQWAAAVVDCGDEAATAEQFPDPSARKMELYEAHLSYGRALAFNSQLPAALEQLHQTTALAVKNLRPTDAEYATAFYWQAFAEHASHMPAEAEQDYATAEASFRKAIVHLPRMTSTYQVWLAHTLANHSVLVSQAGDAARATAMRQEALRLDPHSLDGTPKD